MNNYMIIKYLEYSPELRELVTDIINLKNTGANFASCFTGEYQIPQPSTNLFKNPTA